MTAPADRAGRSRRAISPGRAVLPGRGALRLSRAALREVVAYNQTTRGLTSLYSTVVAEAADPDHPLHDDFARRYRKRAADTAALLRAGQRSGEIAPDIDPDAAARLISAVMDGILQQWLLDATVDMTALFDEFVRGYLRAPRAAASPR
ncbi:TetR family transcriptional regulator C-terminal domain-containing protein [Microbacterium sp. MRS-1]|uniref:TetR family transcriptional regulator C-terminal domain-containing protein n=1 Tax=Microbacterium sp. MRS-1 TaxID=1451261 RepID=UPI0009E01260|nr:TetR family transcriptional regulator C-terminal domain-containing protein [Microbacterium sp. MRS-1]